MKNSKTFLTSGERTELRQIEAASASLVRRAKANPAVARDFLASIGWHGGAKSKGKAGSVPPQKQASTGTATKSAATKCNSKSRRTASRG